MHIQVIDTTGAGDAFVSGFLSVYAQKYSMTNTLEDALLHGCVCAGAAVQCAGGSSAPSRTLLLSVLQQLTQHA
jgi:sugar/nucleoside kinase (ribokinase family)